MTASGPDRETSAERLKAARKAAGFRSARDFALSSGWKESTYRAHESGTRTIGQDDAERYARRLQASGIAIEARDILFGGEPARRDLTLPPLRGDVVRTDIPLPDIAALPRDVPVFGTAQGAVIDRLEGFALDTGKVVEQVPRPPGLAKVPDAYAVFVAGESMAPMHRPGELRYVHPHRPPRGGDSVVILVRQGEGRPLSAFLKLYRGRTPSSVIAEQLNPPAIVELKASTVEAVHLVMSLNDLFLG